MHAIFYDLETSDKEPIGQILNYSFVHVDSDLRPVSELSGTVRISRLQLPRASAILANRIDVLDHQKTAKDDELTAMKRIFDFIVETTRASRDRMALIGFNSSRFDLPFLRTSMIRNGINPYAWNSSVVDRDLLHVARKLSSSHPKFPRQRAEDSAEARLSLRLETLTQALGLLEGKQSHASRDDVLLTIELARSFRNKFGLDPLTYSAYEASRLDREQRKPLVFAAQEPNYDLESSEISIVKPVTLLCADSKYALWLDLKKYKEGQGRRSISYVKKFGGDFFITDTHSLEPSWTQVAEKAQAEFSAITLGNFFAPAICDIEQFIYRLDFDARAALTEAIWDVGAGESKPLNDIDAKILLKRHELRTYEWGGAKDRQVEKDLRSYALRRYGGKVILAKFESDTPEAQPDQYFHPTWQRLLAEITELSTSADPSDRKLLQSLQQFYLTSDIFRVAGRELESLGAPCVSTSPA